MPSTTFTGAGNWHDFNVPKDVTRVTIAMTGGGSRGDGGREAGRVVGDLVVKDTWVLKCFVGEQGAASSGSTGGSGGAGGGARGGDGHQGRAGGDGGGGASIIRAVVAPGDSRLKAVAGGAGGNSGDVGPVDPDHPNQARPGEGGDGGGSNGGQGHKGIAGDGPTGVATGGTQTQGGNGGTSSSGPRFNGADAGNAALDRAGAGGSANAGDNSHGGGGGGGGYHGGGGGAASLNNETPGGGGGGGSNYVGGLTNLKSNGQGTGGVANGQITISWVTPPPANQPPNPPSQVRLGGVDVSNEMHTKIVHSSNVSAEVHDPDPAPKDKVRIEVRWSTQQSFANYSHATSDYVVQKDQNQDRAKVDIQGLSQNTLYYVRVYAQDEHGRYSENYNAFSFWTNQTAKPDHLTVNGGLSGVTIQTIDSATFAWNFNDPDEADRQSRFQIQARTVASTTTVPGPWVIMADKEKGDNLSPSNGPPTVTRNQWVFDPATFKGNTFYEWQVRTWDNAGLVSDWSDSFRFFAASTSTPPIIQSPIGSEAINTDRDVTFKWRFIDPDVGDHQAKADIRWRVIDQTKPLDKQDEDAWFLILGTTTTPGGDEKWTMSGGTFPAGSGTGAKGLQYQWEVRTYDQAGNLSDWSNPALFWAIGTPGSESGPPPIPDFQTPQGSLGCGEYRVFIYEQGGQRMIGEVHAFASLQFSRLRDDISTCLLLTNGLGDADCCDMYAAVRSWMHEIVIFRDGVRVWEGPITRITYTTNNVEFEARDVMVYVYRRIMRQGYNDTYRIIERNPDGSVKTAIGADVSVVERASRIIINALAPYDPNVLPYLTAITNAGDALQSRVVPDWSTTAWEQVDDLAATAGLDYTVIGRRIMLWDTHRAIGRLPTMTDGDFSDPPIVSEYGMQTATFMGVTNGSGIVGTVAIDNKDRPHPNQNRPDYPYGPVEMLASSYNETAAASTDTLTAKALADLMKSLKDQATRNIAHRFPTPLIVRVPDNSSLSPECAIGFQQLVPGVWVPLRASGTCRVVTQWQKLDSIGVEVDSTGEKVSVVLSPAPNGGEDPDLDAAAAEE